VLAGPGHQGEQHGCAAADRDRSYVFENVHVIECDGVDLTRPEGKLKRS
jgi:hypothetical protein